MENFDQEIEDVIEMFNNKDARGIDKFLFRYQEMGMGMLFVALFHALKRTVERSVEATQESGISSHNDTGGGK